MRGGLKLLGRGGTALPGLVAERISPDLLGKLLGPLAGRTVVVSGTNGKTTTARLVSALFTGGNQSVLANRSGSNLIRGLLTTLCTEATLDGTITADRLVLEVDEAVLPELLSRVTPGALVLTNLFRDQLDRYGEVNTLVSRWREALAGLEEPPLLVLNADDPALASLAGASERVVTYGMQASEFLSAEEPKALDAALCPACGEPLEFSGFYISHLSEWDCPNCELSRPDPDLAVTGVEESGLDSMQLEVRFGDEVGGFSLPLGGLYNAYNAASVLALARGLNISLAQAGERLSGVELAFGRQERVEVDGTPVSIVLIKNPAGASETLRLVESVAPESVPLVIINDRTADGHDVSWLWDADFERLNEFQEVVVAGIRGPDMALRLEQAGKDADSIHLMDSVSSGVDRAVELAGPGGSVTALPNYTALFELRNELVRRGAAREFWET